MTLGNNLCNNFTPFATTLRRCDRSGMPDTALQLISRRLGSDPQYKHYCRLLSVSTLSSAQYEPPASADSAAVQQAVKHKLAEFRLGWHNGDKMSFLYDSFELPHPAQRHASSLPADLVEAISFTARKGEAIVEWRMKRIALLEEAAAALSGPRSLNEAIVALMPPHVRHVAGRYNVALIALLTNAIGCEDRFLAYRMVYGL